MTVAPGMPVLATPVLAPPVLAPPVLATPGLATSVLARVLTVLRWDRRGGGRPLALALAVLAAGWAVCASAQAGLRPHQAVYDVRLHQAQQSGQLQAGEFRSAEGRLVVDWRNACTGYVLNQRFVTRLVSWRGEDLLSDLRFSSWEGIGGELFRFSLRNTLNGRVDIETRGTADRDRSHVLLVRPASAKAEGPENREVALKDGVLFPTQLTGTLLRAAAAGERIVQRTVFDGDEDGATFDATAFIGVGGEPLAPGTYGGVPGGAALEGMAFWPVTLSYFPTGGRNSVPDYEVRFRLFANGLSDDLVMSYGDFALKAQLARVLFPEAPDCH